MLHRSTSRTMVERNRFSLRSARQLGSRSSCWMNMIWSLSCWRILISWNMTTVPGRMNKPISTWWRILLPPYRANNGRAFVYMGGFAQFVSILPTRTCKPPDHPINPPQYHLRGMTTLLPHHYPTCGKRINCKERMSMSLKCRASSISDTLPLRAKSQD